MRRIYGTVRISLQSDLCAGSGYSYAGIIDSDVCYDDLGIPYIPARRIKGCMREVLETLLYSKYPDKSVAIFGNSGSSDYDGANSARIRVGNAYIQDYEVIHDFLFSNRTFNGKKQYEINDILGTFTHVVGQTEIENGIANDRSLRYTRVVDRYFSLKGKREDEVQPIVFESEISFEDTYRDAIIDIIAALRHIGTKRNRGYGVVKCSFKEANASNYVVYNDLFQIDEGKDTTEITFAVVNTDPLMLSGEKEDVTRDYITAQSVIGLLAKEYLKKNGLDKAETEEFTDLFINGRTSYTHLYPCLENRIQYPAPEYLNILKKTKKYVYTLARNLPENGIPEEYDYRNGNQPKKLKGKFVSIENGQLSVLEVSKDIIFHNRHADYLKKGTDESYDSAMLYTSEVITPGQIFAGSITVPSKYKEELFTLLREAQLCFGKSRSAQYGHCKLINAKGINVGVSCDDKIESGHPVLVTFLSDTILLNKNSCEYTVYYDEIKNIIKDQLEIPVSDKESDTYLSSIQTTLITGFSGVWNLRKAPIPAIKAGSYMVFQTTSNYEPKIFTLGELTHEGFGRVQITNAERYNYMAVPGLQKLNLLRGNPYNLTDDQKGKIRSILLPIFVQKWLNDKINNYLDKSLGGNNSAVGRYKLMLTESVGGAENLEEAYIDFRDRIDHIKKDASKSTGLKLINWINEFRRDVENNNTVVNTLNKMGLLSNGEEKVIYRKMRDCWADFAMSIIVNRKYT